MERQQYLGVALGVGIFLLGMILPGLALQPFRCALPTVMLDRISQDDQSLLQKTSLADERAMVPSQVQCPVGALPEQQWEENDLAILSGCWKLTTDLTLHDEDGGGADPLASWVICFDEAGHGSQKLSFQNGTACTGPVQASFAAQNRLLLQEPTPCSGGTNVVLGQWSCTRIANTSASCTRSYINDPTTHHAVFQR